MRVRSLILSTLVVAAGCSPRVAVDQVMIKLGSERPSDIVSLIEGRLAAHGFEGYSVSHPDSLVRPWKRGFMKTRAIPMQQSPSSREGALDLSRWWN